jgi:hypothetical protein
VNGIQSYFLETPFAARVRAYPIAEPSKTPYETKNLNFTGLNPGKPITIAIGPPPMIFVRIASGPSYTVICAGPGKASRPFTGFFVTSAGEILETKF